MVPGLTPIINIETVQTRFLGKPFTECIRKPNYSVTQCKYKALLTQITHICQCFPTYMKDGANLIEVRNYSDCTYVMHASCVSFVTKKYQENEKSIKCLPACTSKSIHQESIHYSRLDQKNVDYLMESRESPDDLEVVSTTIRIAEVSTKMFEEKVDYPFGELISEIGGSLGVFLGLSIIDVVVFGREVLKRLQRITMLIFRRLKTQCARKTQPTSPSTISSPSSLTMNSKLLIPTFNLPSPFKAIDLTKVRFERNDILTTL